MVDHAVLFLGSKRLNNSEIAKAIRTSGANPLLYAQSIREAHELLEKRTAAAAFIPASRNDSQIYSLRTLQPELPVMLITEHGEQPVRDRQRQAAVGVITQFDLLSRLSQIDLFKTPTVDLTELLLDTPEAISAESRQRSPLVQQFSKLARAVLKHPLVRFVILQLPDHEPIAYHRANNQAMLREAASQLPKLASDSHTQIRFLELTDENGLYETALMYSRPIQQGVITVGSDPAATVSEIRSLLNRAISALLAGHEIGDLLPPLVAVQQVRQQVAAIWKANRPLSEPEALIIGEVIQHVAKKHKMGVHFTDIPIGDRIVHLVVDRPPGRSSAWIVQLFKKESEKVLRIEGERLRQSLWQDGFFAKPSQEPLSAAEIAQFV